MHWLVGAALVLILSLIFDLALLAYAMYALLAVLLVKALRWLLLGCGLLLVL